MDVDATHLVHFADRLDRTISRLTMGIITEALIIGSSIVMTVKCGSTVFGLHFFGLLGFGGAVLGGIRLLL